MHSIDQSADALFDRYPTCFDACEGHIDPSCAHLHSTAWSHFGEFGVAVTQTDGRLPVVSLVDMPRTQSDYTPTQARVLAYQLLLAADLAERAAQPSITADITRQLMETLAGAAR